MKLFMGLFSIAHCSFLWVMDRINLGLRAFFILRHQCLAVPENCHS